MVFKIHTVTLFYNRSAIVELQILPSLTKAIERTNCFITLISLWLQEDLQNIKSPRNTAGSLIH